MVLDSVALSDPSLLTIGDGCRVGNWATAAGAMVAPAGMLGDAPALLMSEVRCWKGSEATT